jgi:hypothetical protein
VDTPPDAAGFVLFSKQFGSRGLQPGLYLPQTNIRFILRRIAQSISRTGPIAKGHRQPTILDGQGQINDVGGPSLVDPPLALHGYAQFLQSHVQLADRAFLLEEVVDLACTRS